MFKSCSCSPRLFWPLPALLFLGRLLLSMFALRKNTRFRFASSRFGLSPNCPLFICACPGKPGPAAAEDLTVLLVRIKILLESFKVVSLFSYQGCVAVASATSIRYHIFAAVSTTFFEFFNKIRLLFSAKFTISNFTEKCKYYFQNFTINLLRSFLSSPRFPFSGRYPGAVEDNLFPWRSSGNTSYFPDWNSAEA